MQLLINKSLKKSIYTVELETINFTKQENDLLDQFGEYVFDFECMYKGGFPVSIHKKIRSNFKVRVKFDGTKDMVAATEAVNQFIEDIKSSLEDEHKIITGKTYKEWLDDKENIIGDLDKGLGKDVVTISPDTPDYSQCIIHSPNIYKRNF